MRPVVPNMVLSDVDITQAIVVFMAGEHDDAISRIDDVISTVHFSSICYVVQARAFVTTRQALPLILSLGIYASPAWKFTYREW